MRIYEGMGQRTTGRRRCRSRSRREPTTRVAASVHGRTHDGCVGCERRSPLHIAIVGGARFDPVKLETFIFKLAEKHPNALIVTGNGRGSEQEVASRARAIGLTVSQPEVHPEWYGAEALMCQINDILIEAGSEAVVVLVGTGARPTRAREIVERIDKYMKVPRLIHEVAKVPTKEREPRPQRAKKPIYD